MSVDLDLTAPETVYRVLSEDGSELVAEPPAVPDADLRGKGGLSRGGRRPGG